MVSSCGPDVRAPFSLSLTLPVLDWRLAMQGFIFCQHVQANTRRPLLIGTDSLSGKIQPSPSEPSAPRWVEIFCRLLQEVKEQGGGKEEQKKRGPHAPEADHRGLYWTMAPVCTCGVSSQIRRFWLLSLLVPPCCYPSLSSSSTFSLSLHSEASAQMKGRADKGR